ncbi:molybdopterin-dependent oxidoreductase [Adlercreutzia sp. ZJ304]|uniref:molybdopterin-dependent oxidoreductase n=1 Tax=Adlercreutzia sp. ZJ304 TaxID=2709791 RepID=UPI0013ECF459|nr:molybdopterin-dependent oxidoreductase [Adlercreutzia sp. ZJ304]
MSGGKSLTGITRRGFVKGAATVGALGVMAGGMATTSEWLAPAKAHAEGSSEKIGYTFHNRHCQCLCSHKCTVRDGRLVLIEPNDAFSNAEASICAKGIGEVQHVYSKERIQTPMIRTGERGSGEFKSVSWDEALDRVADTIKDIQSKNGKDSVLTIMAGEVRTTEYLFLQKVLGAKGVSDGAMNEGIDIGFANGFDKAFGEMNYAQSTNMYKDWKRSKYVLNVGSNLLETTLTYSSNFFDAIEAGTKIVTVDPHFSLTASKSTEWVPIKPGTDAALYLGMISKIIDDELFDRDYLTKYTSMPFLVGEDGALLRNGEEPSEDKDGKKIDPADYMVWDAAVGAPVRHNLAANPVLEGKFEKDGNKYSTVFLLLKNKQKDYSLDWASKETGIPKAKLEEITNDYALMSPQILSTGLGGGDKFENADVAGHAQAILAALVGSIGADTGAGVGSYVLTWRRDKVNFGAWPLPATYAAGKSAKGIFDIRDDNGIHAVITGGNCLHDRIANMNKTKEWLNKLDFVVAIDMYHTPSTDYADVILPACTRYESDEDAGMLHSSHHSVLLKGKVIDPLFESKTDFWIERELCKRFGAEADLPSTAEELVRKQLATAKDERVAAVTVEDLLANKCVIPIPRKATEEHLYTNKEFKTPSKKLELYYEDLLSSDNALPTYERPGEAYDENPMRKEYPLQFAQVRTKYLTHCAFADAEWNRQYANPTVYINPENAKERNIQSGDNVRVFNNRGEFSCEAALDESVRPGSVKIYEGWWSKHMKSGNMQEVTSDKRNLRGADYKMYGPVIPFNDTLVEVQKA